jgi:hypothetical protein
MDIGIGNYKMGGKYSKQKNIDKKKIKNPETVVPKQENLVQGISSPSLVLNSVDDEVIKAALFRKRKPLKYFDDPDDKTI